jgi:hypothetical protein
MRLEGFDADVELKVFIDLQSILTTAKPSQHRFEITLRAPGLKYLVEENRVLLREQIGARRIRFTDDQRRRLAARAKELGRNILAQVATIVRPEPPTGMASETNRK